MTTSVHRGSSRGISTEVSKGSKAGTFNRIPLLPWRPSVQSVCPTSFPSLPTVQILLSLALLLLPALEAAAAPPSISSVAATNITATSATITWTTNQPATSQVEYGTTTSYGSSTPINTTLKTSHSLTLTGLAGNTTYYYRVKSKNAQGQTTTSSRFSFKTPQALPPVTYAIQYWSLPAGYNLSYVSRMNNRGQIVGYMTDAENKRFGFLYDRGISASAAIDLNSVTSGVPEGWKIAAAAGINDQGVLVGNLAPLNDESVRKPFLLDTSAELPWVVVPLPDWNSTRTTASDINENGDVFGYLTGTDGQQYAYLYNPADGSPQFLDTPIRSNVYAGFLNNPDPSTNRPAQVTGYLADGQGFVGTPFRWTPGAPLETFSSLQNAVVTGINDAGTICGSTEVTETITVPGPGKKTTTRTVTTRYPMRLGTSLELLQGIPAEGAGTINATGDLILFNGSTVLYRDDWTAYGNYVNINQLVAGSAADENSWFNTADVIDLQLMNDRGGPANCAQIGGRAWNSADYYGTVRGFLLTPVPAP